MKTHSKIGHIIFVFGILSLSIGSVRLIGALEYNSFISNKSIAILFIAIGVSVMFFSFFVKPIKDK
ncbi:hypothetical protein [Lysinibacillus fusiformis]|uniref:Uncharacterized protein n=1 Tax=Lysinibacillus fusiformis TaxID=28031 RepID=A0A1E4R9K2_9BACI|nr:hypothetical protein [Lysinibacillus fusiformis]ODV57140.1 hypothetical protein BG258_15105 [Lysinibacillus fusiformis]HBJ01198.1 hypothetical protein [Lysinibacillus sp.]